MTTRKQKQKNKRQSENSFTPGESVSRYVGPIVPQQMVQQVSLVTKLMGYQFDAATDASGNYSIATLTDLTLLQDWASFVSNYREFRILGVKLMYMPSKKYTSVNTTANITKNAVFCAIDRNGPTFTPYVAVNGIIQNESCKMYSFEEPWQRSWRMNGLEESGFTPASTTNGPSFVAFQLYSTGNQVSYVMGKFYMQLLVEWRGGN
jgi:hypothetical protein